MPYNPDDQIALGALDRLAARLKAEDDARGNPIRLRNVKRDNLQAARDLANAIIESKREPTAEEYDFVRHGVELAAERRKELDRAAETQEKLHLIGDVPAGYARDGHGGYMPTAGASAAKGHLRLGGLKSGILSGFGTYMRQTSPGLKGLTPSGSITVPTLITGDPLPGSVDGERPPRLLDVLPAVGRDAPVYITRVRSVIADPGGAAVVAPGDTKRRLGLGVENVERRLRVVAVVSEPIDRFILADESNLTAWVGSELAESVWRAIELEVLDGSGEGEHFRGIANTSGIQTQALVNDPLTTLQYGIAKLEDLGVAPAFAAVSSTDWLAITTTRNASGAFDLNPQPGGPVNAVNRTAWGVPVTTVPGLEPGYGYVVGQDAVELSVDTGGIQVDWNPYSGWETNEVQARCEVRSNLDVLAPHRIVEVQLGGA
ncbi:hypothetical protein Xcel_2063 [Xylanimonas cellulosilytica DSM 15894]|uniref:Phage capsid-like C-terminal domain-containing protein n=1 Tax=Xylanimonas cellulosilytica (strain DSM 15894 / JCM 12276 / CECT 5975 / KCTC 9989 / LMG 20990 / NBRC 107835 / XIL07) TaxID=446471 RepID=D1BU68_XYLCX|nr:phage major capsid protein [Xylanimonas cellulosilytica]ACZ31081.1 hypothetical protein Xcel_2063 [Xylanimonas cellulosilytica DSM 15894]